MELNDLLSSISAEDMDKLKATAAQFLGGGASEGEPSGGGGLPELAGIDPSVLNGVTKFAGVMREKDSRCDLLMALKPLLSETRRPKADEAITILRLTKLMDQMRGGIR